MSAYNSTISGDAEAEATNAPENSYPEDMIQAAKLLARLSRDACAVDTTITGLRIELGATYFHRIYGVTSAGERICIFDPAEGDYEILGVFDRSWSNHCAEPDYTARFEALIRLKLSECGCPPCEFTQPGGQQGRLLQMRDALQRAIGERREISAVLGAIAPFWAVEDSDEHDTLFMIESGAYPYGAPEYFMISWCLQEADDDPDSSEYMQLRIELTYPLEAACRDMYDLDEAYDGAGFEREARGSDSYNWALGRQATSVAVYLSGT